ncbi:MAG: hypothetical protein A3K45_05070 [Chloroflexi bacterium RIFOXYC12_FULL_59_14]|nr:MAG: hypothetical protein A3K45_05070 [Chloroflexi bacterium RIFOXYC12_FULL_59_14]
MNRPTIFSITEDEIDLNDLLAQITLDSTGAAAIFTGMVRGITSRGEPHETVYLEYESYTPMAEAKMKQVADEIRARWNTIEGITIVQRIGRLYPMSTRLCTIILWRAIHPLQRKSKLFTTRPILESRPSWSVQ